jgi:hypothetical protein
MLETRSFFATGELGGQIIIVGGHDGSKNMLQLAWVYHVRRDEWAKFALMSQERDECEGVVIRSEFWVVSGYMTKSQGGIEGTCGLATQCPKSCVGVGKMATGRR